MVRRDEVNEGGGSQSWDAKLAALGHKLWVLTDKVVGLGGAGNGDEHVRVQARRDADALGSEKDAIETGEAELGDLGEPDAERGAWRVERGAKSEE